MRYATILLVGLAFTLASCGGSEEVGTAFMPPVPDSPSSIELRAQRFAYDGCLSTFRATSASVVLDAVAATWASDREYGGPDGIPTDELAALTSGCTIALSGGADPVTRDRVCGDRAPAEATTDELADVAPKPKKGKVLCPGIILKVGPAIMLRCRRGAEIVKARSVEVDRRYCAKVTYIAVTGSPAITETLCEDDVPSAGGEPVTGHPFD